MVAIAVSLAAEQTYAKLHPELELSSATHSQKKQASSAQRARTRPKRAALSMAQGSGTN